MKEVERERDTARETSTLKWNIALSLEKQLTDAQQQRDWLLQRAHKKESHRSDNHGAENCVECRALLYIPFAVVKARAALNLTPAATEPTIMRCPHCGGERWAPVSPDGPPECFACHSKQRQEMRPLCKCGRFAFFALNDPTPYCSACEYQPCETCDCAPLATQARAGGQEGPSAPCSVCPHPPDVHTYREIAVDSDTACTKCECHRYRPAPEAPRQGGEEVG